MKRAVPGTTAFSGKLTEGVMLSAEGIRYCPLASLAFSKAKATGLTSPAAVPTVGLVIAASGKLQGYCPDELEQVVPSRLLLATAARPAALRSLVRPAGTVSRDRPIS